MILGLGKLSKNKIVIFGFKLFFFNKRADELTLNIGVRVNVLEKFGDGWWKIVVDNHDAEQQIPLVVGLYPSNYLLEDAPLLVNSISSSSSKFVS